MMEGNPNHSCPACPDHSLSNIVKILYQQCSWSWIFIVFKDKCQWSEINASVLHVTQIEQIQHYLYERYGTINVVQPLLQWCEIQVLFQKALHNDGLQFTVHKIMFEQCTDLKHFDTVLHIDIYFHWIEKLTNEIEGLLDVLRCFLIVFGTMPALPRDLIHATYDCWDCRFENALCPKTSRDCSHMYQATSIVCTQNEEEPLSELSIDKDDGTKQENVNDDISQLPPDIQMRVRQIAREKHCQKLILDEIKHEMNALNCQLEYQLAPKVLTLCIFEKFHKLNNFVQSRRSTIVAFQNSRSDVPTSSENVERLMNLLECVVWSDHLQNEVLDLFFRISMDPHTLDKSNWRLETTYRMWMDAAGMNIQKVCNYIDKLRQVRPKDIVTNVTQNNQTKAYLFRCCYMQCLMKELAKKHGFMSPNAYRADKWNDCDDGFVYLYDGDAVGVQINDTRYRFRYEACDFACLTWLYHVSRPTQSIHRHIFNNQPLVVDGPLFYPLTK